MFDSHGKSWVTKGRAICAATLALSAVICAPAMAEDKLSDAYTDMTAQIALLTNQNPALSDLRVLLMGDCRENFPQMQEPHQSEFCLCGSRLTMTLWLRDQDMNKRLNDYIESPSEDGLADFLNYQGPELYQPFCDAVTGGENG